MKMRAKLKIESVLSMEYIDQLKFRASYSDTKEDNTYSKATPTAELTMTVTNPDLIGKFRAGQSFYVDFTPIP